MPRLIPSKKFLADLEKFRSAKALTKKIAKAFRSWKPTPSTPGFARSGS